MSDIEKAKRLIAELLKTTPDLGCHDFHHSKKDQHNHDEPCKPLARYWSTIIEAREFIKKP